MANAPQSTQPQPPNPDTPSTSFKRLHGTFVDGKWWCNCQPNRRPAVYRKVEKDTPNKGKAFWACPLYSGCNFFLFCDEARAREGGVQITTLPEDQPHRPKTPTLTQSKLTAYGVLPTPGRRRQSRGELGEEEEPQKTPEPTPTITGSVDYPSTAEMTSALRTPDSAKRKRQALEESAGKRDDSESDFSDFAVDSDDERQLIDLADASAKKASADRARGMGSTTGDLVTPETGTRTIAGLPTPSSVSRNLFPSDRPRRKSVFDPATPVGHGLKENEGDTDDDDETIIGDNPHGEASFTSTATLPTTDSPSTTNQSDNSAEVLSILSSHGVNISAQRAVQSLLTISARRARGVEKSRDGLREELRKQKIRNAKLQDKIAALEDKLKVRNRSMSNLKAGLMELYEDN